MNLKKINEFISNEIKYDSLIFLLFYQFVDISEVIIIIMQNYSS